MTYRLPGVHWSLFSKFINPATRFVSLIAFCFSSLTCLEQLQCRVNFGAAACGLTFSPSYVVLSAVARKHPLEVWGNRRSCRYILGNSTRIGLVCYTFKATIGPIGDNRQPLLLEAGQPLRICPRHFAYLLSGFFRPWPRAQSNCEVPTFFWQPLVPRLLRVSNCITISFGALIAVLQ